VLRAISGHRDTGPTECPGSTAYAALPAIARAVAQTGLPKIYAPQVSGGLGGKVRFTARLSASLGWSVTITDALNRPVAGGTGKGTTLDWTWDASAIPSGSYGYTISAGPDARPVTGTLGAPLAQLTVTALKASPAIFTPNADGFSDAARISYRLGAPATVTATLTDPDGKTTYATLFSGFHGAGDHAFVWKGAGVPDGNYRVVVSARNAAGATASGTVAVTVDRTLASFSLSPRAISPNGDGYLDAATLSFTLLNPANYFVQLKQNGESTTIQAGHAQPGPQSIPIGGNWKGANGRASVVVITSDPVAVLTRSAPLVLDTTPPRLRAISLRRLVFWVSEPARVTAEIDRHAIVKRVRRGVFRLPFRGRPRHVYVVATDPAGNTSRPIRRP
jgi:hypothetical protein